MARIARLNGYYLRAPLSVPVVNAFARMDARQTLLVRVEDDQGRYGWGEIWCNFPSWGGAHRARLLEYTIAPWYVGRAADDPAATMRTAIGHFHIMSLQCGERGPFANVLAGIDCALWDLAARTASLPLARMLGGEVRTVPAYASGVNPTGPMDQINAARAEGYRAFKLKIGFANDDENLDLIGASLGEGEQLFVDVNQGYDIETARRRLPGIADRGVGWIEEPVAADMSLDLWRELAAASSVPLAGGENVGDLPDFASVVDKRIFGIVQPDLAKWGGQSLCREVANMALEAGLRYCPHYLGGGVGLLHSAHLLAAVGGDGLLEVDCNDNPLRSSLVDLPPLDAEGGIPVADQPGIGADPANSVISEFLKFSVEMS